MIEKAPFRRLVQGIIRDFKSDLRIQTLALLALQESAEAMLVCFLESM